jgi:hypothetical protein
VGTPMLLLFLLFSEDDSIAVFFSIASGRANHAQQRRGIRTAHQNVCASTTRRRRWADGFVLPRLLRKRPSDLTSAGRHARIDVSLY